MTPLDFAARLVKSGDHDSKILGIAILVRGLTDDDPSDPLKMPWPMSAAVVKRAAAYLGTTVTPTDIGDVFDLAPDLSDALLNKAIR